MCPSPSLGTPHHPVRRVDAPLGPAQVKGVPASELPTATALVAEPVICREFEAPLEMGLPARNYIALGVSMAPGAL